MFPTTVPEEKVQSICILAIKENPSSHLLFSVVTDKYFCTEDINKRKTISQEMWCLPSRQGWSAFVNLLIHLPKKNRLSSHGLEGIAPSAGSSSEGATRMGEYLLSTNNVPDTVWYVIYIISVLSPINPKTCSTLWPQWVNWGVTRREQKYIVWEARSGWNRPRAGNWVGQGMVS